MPMKRRDFTKSLAALVAAPAIPMKAFAAAPAATASLSVATTPNLYTWSAMIARTQGRCSADLLAKTLHIDTSQATNLFNRLVANNVVGTANAAGIAKAKSIMPVMEAKTAPIIDQAAKDISFEDVTDAFASEGDEEPSNALQRSTIPDAPDTPDTLQS